MIEASIASVAPFVDLVIAVLGRFKTFPEIPGEDPTKQIVYSLTKSFPNIIVEERDFASQWDIGGGRDFFLGEAWQRGIVRKDDWIFLIDGDEVLKTTGRDFNRIRSGIYQKYHTLPLWLEAADKEGFSGWQGRLEHLIGKGHWAFPEGSIDYEGELEGVYSLGRWHDQITRNPEYPKLYETTLLHYALHKCTHRDLPDKEYSKAWRELVGNSLPLAEVMF